MPRTLRAVEPGDLPDSPKNLVEAIERSRPVLLARQRLQLAQVIDAGVPAHALARLIAELDRIDTEIRRLDDAEEREGERASADDEPFDAAAV